MNEKLKKYIMFVVAAIVIVTSVTYILNPFSILDNFLSKDFLSKAIKIKTEQTSNIDKDTLTTVEDVVETTKYYVIVGSFKVYSNANNFVASFKDDYDPAYVELVYYKDFYCVSVFRGLKNNCESFAKQIDRKSWILKSGS